MEQNEIQVLVEKSRRQDASAFALLVAEYQTFVFRLAFRLLCDEEEARDMVQETFLRVWLSLISTAGVPFFHLALQGIM